MEAVHLWNKLAFPRQVSEEKSTDILLKLQSRQIQGRAAHHM